MYRAFFEVAVARVLVGAAYREQHQEVEAEGGGAVRHAVVVAAGEP